jgi:hypothetical protein
MVDAGEAEPVDEYFARRARHQGYALPVFEQVRKQTAEKACGCGGKGGCIAAD